MTTLKARRNQLLSHAIAALLMTGASTAAFGQTMTLQNNQLQIAGGSGTTFSNQTPTISALGVVQTVLDVPTTNGVGIPSFNFTIQKDVGVLDGNYNFRVAVTFEDASIPNRRMEAEIGTLTLNVTGGVITGSIPNQNMKVLGRNGAGTLQVDITVPNQNTNGPVTVTGGTVSFNATNLISRIRSSHTLFDTVILAEFNQPATYKYRITVQQTSGPATLQFGTSATSPAFTAFPRVQTPACGTANCVNNNAAFVLKSNELASGYTDAYTVTGQFNVVTVSSGGGGGGTTTPVTTTALTNTVAAIVVPTSGPVSTAVVTQINTAVTSSNTLLSSTLTQLQSGGSAQLNNDALAALTATNAALTKAGDAKKLEGGSTISTTDTSTAISNIAGVLGALSKSTTPLTTQQKTQVDTLVTSTVTSATNLITKDTPRSEVLALVESTSKLLQSSTDATGEIKAALVTQLKALSTTATQAILPTLPESIRGNVDLNSIDALRALTSAKATVKAVVVRTAPETCFDEATALRAALDEIGQAYKTGNLAGITGLNAKMTSANIAFTACKDRLEAALQRSNVQTQPLANASSGGILLPATTEPPRFSSNNAGTLATYDGRKYPTSSPRLRIAPSILADGLSSLPNGTLLYVNAGTATELVGGPANPLALMNAIAAAQFAPSLREDGSLSIDLGNNQRFAGAFALQDIGTAGTACESASFLAPSGAATSASHVYQMVCSDGARQSITPYPDNTVFFDTVTNAGFDLRTDRNTGVITIEGAGNFRPSFFASALSTADQTYLNANKNADGVAFRAKDANGDGRMDYEFLTSTGVQLFYGLP